MSEPVATTRAPEGRIVPAPARPRRLRRALAWILGILALIIAYYAIGSVLYYRIDDDPAFAAPTRTPGGSRAVDMAAALIGREVDEHAWQPNDPRFMPNGLLIHPSAFQAGIQGALARFSIELEDQIGRARGSSRADPDLERARGLLNFPPDVWIFDFRTSWLPMVTSERNYRAARAALASYNQRMGRGEATFEVRADALVATLQRIVNDLGAQSALTDQHLRDESGWLINFDADRQLYGAKGRLYGYHMLLRELGEDYRPLIEQRNLQTVWGQAMATMEEAGRLSPLIVLDGRPAGRLFANHLAMQGFQLKRAMVQLNEVAQVLVK
jgi:hypothetical protein